MKYLGKSFVIASSRFTIALKGGSPMVIFVMFMALCFFIMIPVGIAITAQQHPVIAVFLTLLVLLVIGAAVS